MSAFAVERRIRFSDCDPAGIVFYPQYFVMFNSVVEDWFNGPLGVGYQHLVVERRVGLPTVRLEAEFKAVSRFGDPVVLTLDVERLGRRSFTLLLRCTGAAGQLRMQMRQVIVTTSLETHQAIDIPPDVQAAIQRRAPPIVPKESP
ncbi:acyl-CoA thioesterase [Ramlibacter henchirensis]|uniref:Acyl-CoA thioesterase n=1 Tax=Ramlibacter henchirensis TaxID=204072 RepID=A0A4Z0BRI4_9BURK|nr:thioesterase family protein [Ramlibacter henchirensis]TFZ00858.1 acyl-CoA thioesterase [Ramlibacter henchirensis]